MYQVPFHITHVGCLELLISTSIHLVLSRTSLQHVSILWKMTLNLPISDVTFHYRMLHYIEDFLNWIQVRRVPVSYTHLDVYKRQDLHCLLQFYLAQCNFQ